MKIVEITPRRKVPLYGALIRREADIRSKGRGTFARQGRKRARSAIWKHKRFKGTVNLQREGTEHNRKPSHIGLTRHHQLLLRE